jgi:Animal haem peroxidase
MRSKRHPRSDGSTLTRRQFLGRVGAGAAGAAALGTVGSIGIDALERVAAHADPSSPASSSPLFFGRIFPKLPPFAQPSDQLTAALRDLGKPGGYLDAKDNLAAGPVLLITDPSLSANNPNNPTHTAGTHFMGQFMDHDITFDTSSKLGTPTEPTTSPNGRTPTFDIDAMYGGGPMASPQLYQSNGIKLLIESTPDGLHEDLPRNADSSAIIGDPRNDENMMIAGLHCAFILAHNNTVDFVKNQHVPSSQLFAQARQLLRWHYHWMILHEFLPLFVGQDMVNTVLTQGRKFYTPPVGGAFMPVEFQGACYRFGHSMVRPSYRANFKGDNGGPFFGLIFDPAAEAANPSDPDDLTGGARANRRFIGWPTFFDFSDGNVKPNKRIDRHISTPMFNLPLAAIASHDQPTALPQRNLLRQVTWSMPSGQSIAKVMGVNRVSPSDLNELSAYGLGLEKSTPLWYYALAEAEVMEQGLHLGPVGGRIVAEVIIGLMQTDPGSYLFSNPTWTPTLPAKYSGSGQFKMIDLLAFAGVDGVR